MHTSKIRNHIVSTKTVKNDLYLTAIINSQEQEIQRLQDINSELKIQLLKYNVSFSCKFIILYFIINLI